MTRWSLAMCAAVVACLLTTPLVRADDAGDALKAKVLDAYKGVTSYQATIDFRFEKKDGRWTSVNSTWVKVAYERPGKLVVDRPEFLLVSDGKTHRVRVFGFDQNHVETPAGELTYDALRGLMSLPQMGALIDQPMMFVPDVALLTAVDPLEPFRALEITAIEPDAQQRAGLRIKGQTLTWTLRLDPKTNLVSQAVAEQAAPTEPGDAGKAPGAGGDYERMVYDFKITAHNKALAEDAFALDTSKSQAVKSIEALVSGAAGAGDPGGEEKHPLEGKAAPAIALKTLEGKDYDLAKETADVVVFDFWATWCPPCRKGLPELQKVYDWAVKNKKSVAIYAVNLEETEQQVDTFWKGQKLSIPVLMDTKSAVANAYRVEGIPQTVIIRKGKIEHIHVGLLPNMADVVQGQIEELLKQGASN